VIGVSKRYHFVGISGAGMSGLAAVMLAAGSHVSGSDLHGNEETDSLERFGAAIHIGHDASLVDEKVDEVIVSSAIPSENIEVQTALKLRLPVVHRLHALAHVLDGYTSVGVAGTHGKTTTTAMTATIMRDTGKDPSYLIGAHCPGLGGNSHLGSGEVFISEVDESDGLFLAIRPTIAVLNNIGRDHLGTYHSLESIKESFRQYVMQAEKSVLAIDDVAVRLLASEIPTALTVGTYQYAELRAVNVSHYHFHTTFDLMFRGRNVTKVFLPAPGDHNVRNSLCAIGAAFLAGVPLKEAANALADFRLPKRRFQLLEENGVTVVDDYAHLPEEIEVTLQAIRSGWSNRRIVAVFQPHRYSRTREIGREFGTAFQLADTVIVTPIYPAHELPIPGVSSQAVVDSITEKTGKVPLLIENKKEVLSFLKRYIEPGDFIISFGAGDIWTVTTSLSRFLEEGSFCTI
jgi:UDP-N-acetylmuramate--alanine ligase